MFLNQAPGVPALHPHDAMVLSIGHERRYSFVSDSRSLDAVCLNILFPNLILPGQFHAAIVFRIEIAPFPRVHGAGAHLRTGSLGP